MSKNLEMKDVGCKEVIFNNNKYRVFEDCVFFWTCTNPQGIWNWVQMNLNSEYAKPIVEHFGLQEQARKDIGIKDVEEVTLKKFNYEDKEIILMVEKGLYLILGDKPQIIKNEYPIMVFDNYFGDNV